MDERKKTDLYKNQPIMCPWITGPPNLGMKTKFQTPSINNNLPSDAEKSCGSLKQSSSCFFYFVRLMQLFPETHPATLHTVLTLCENNFFRAVDKLLYAKHCKKMYNKTTQKRTPYQKELFVGKTIILQSSEKDDENKSNKLTTINSETLVENEKEKNVETVPSSCNKTTVDGQTMAKLEEFLLCNEKI